MRTEDVETAEADPISDEELTALALAADPDAPLAADAVNLWELDREDGDELLPAWYMPSPMGTRRLTGWRRRVAILLIVAFLLIDAYGLCSTYGDVVLA